MHIPATLLYLAMVNLPAANFSPLQHSVYPQLMLGGHATTARQPMLRHTPLALAAQSVVPQPHFRFISANKTATMQKELNELARQGFRLERVAKNTIGSNVAALMVRDPVAPGNTPYEYKLLATRKIETLEKELTEVAGQGFELRGLTAITRPLIGGETIAILERPLGSTQPRYIYRLLSAEDEATMQQELAGAVRSAFTPVDVIYGQDNGAASILIGPSFVYTVVLSRSAAGTEVTPEGRAYKFLAANKVSTMEREMNEAAKEGYVFACSSPGLLVTMYRGGEASNTSRYEYKLLATRRTATMQKELEEHGKQGFAYLATTSGLGGLVTVLGRDLMAAPEKTRHDYKLLSASREGTTQREIAETIAAGYLILDLTTLGEFVMVLDRKVEYTVEADHP